MWREENEDKKEKVTFENIRKDINSVYYHQIFVWVGFIVLAFLLYKLADVWIEELLDVSMWVNYCLNAMFAVVLAILISAILADIVTLTALIPKNKFAIVTDELVEASEGRLSAVNLMLGSLFWKPHTFRFAAFGKYYAGYGRQYTWSKLYSLGGRDLFNASYPGDTFILVMRGKNILAIYNTRLFEAAEGLLK